MENAEEGEWQLAGTKRVQRPRQNEKNTDKKNGEGRGGRTRSERPTNGAPRSQRERQGNRDRPNQGPHQRNRDYGQQRQYRDNRPDQREVSVPEKTYSLEEKELVNPLFKRVFKRRSVETTEQMHFMRLCKNGHKYNEGGVLFGDSGIERYLSTGASKRFNPETQQLEDDPEGKNLWAKWHKKKFINLGVGGDGISNARFRLFEARNWDREDRRKYRIIDLLPAKPKNFIIWLGTNDVETYSATVVFDGIIKLIEDIKECYKKDGYDLPVSVVSILPRFTRSDKISVSGLNQSIQRLNWNLAQVADNFGYKFFDAFYYFYKDNKILSEYYDDHVHLNAKGYERFDNLFYKFVTGEESPDKSDEEPIENSNENSNENSRERSNDKRGEKPRRRRNKRRDVSDKVANSNTVSEHFDDVEGATNETETKTGLTSEEKLVADMLS